MEVRAVSLLIALSIICSCRETVFFIGFDLVRMRRLPTFPGLLLSPSSPKSFLKPSSSCLKLLIFSFSEGTGAFSLLTT